MDKVLLEVGQMPTLVSPKLLYPLVAISSEGVIARNSVTKALYDPDTKLMWSLRPPGTGNCLLPFDSLSDLRKLDVYKLPDLAPCSARAYRDYLNINTWAGFSDWRLPDVWEARSLSKFSKHVMMDSDLTLVQCAQAYFWTSQIDSDSQNHTGLVVSGIDGNVKASSLLDAFQVICVREHTGGIPSIRTLNKANRSMFITDRRDCPF
jgi:hypothetical protein